MLLTTKRPQARASQGSIQVIPRGATIGAEVQGVDFSKPVDTLTTGAIHDALMRYSVIYFRDAAMTPAQHVDFGRLFGELTVHPFVPHLDEFPEVVVLDNHEDNPVFSTDHWHSDETFRVMPPMGSILRCLVRPETGGETLWCDMVAAYDGLSDKMKNFVSGLEAIHDFKNFRHKFDALPPRERHAKLAEMEEELPNPVHPVVRTHPITKRKALFVNEQFTLAIKGMREYQFRFHWEVNSMVFWDNRPLQHYAANDYYPQRRTMHRVTIKGDKPF
jgi:taurine dioxygenase